MPGQPLRTPEQIREHYEVEKELSNRLRSANRDERRNLYGEVYDELYRRVPHHPQLTRKDSADMRARALKPRMSILRRFLKPNVTFLELGPGDCSLSIEVAQHVKQVYAVDVSTEITRSETLPDNLEVILSDGVSVPVSTSSVDVAYSNQLMEHLHPEDAAEQLTNLVRTLKPGGIYVCITPNRLDGPHDISKGFDEVATGFHLKEYTVGELTRMFKRTGFTKVSALLSKREYALPFVLPVAPFIWYEAIVARLPRGIRRTLARPLGLVKLVGVK